MIEESFGLEDQSRYDNSNLEFHQEKETIDDTLSKNIEVMVVDQSSSPKMNNSYKGLLSEHDDLDENACFENLNNMQIEGEGEQFHNEEKHRLFQSYIDLSG